jgi:phosphoribosylformylglycinamidine cyclo-ligase
MFQVDSYIPELSSTLADELLKIHRSYKWITDIVLKKVGITGMAHITGGGVLGNIRRILPEGLDLKIIWSNFPNFPIFTLIQNIGKIDSDEMRRIFNLGIGYSYILRTKDVNTLAEILEKNDVTYYYIGEIV